MIISLVFHQTAHFCRRIRLSTSRLPDIEMSLSAGTGIMKAIQWQGKRKRGYWQRDGLCCEEAEGRQSVIPCTLAVSTLSPSARQGSGSTSIPGDPR